MRTSVLDSLKKDYNLPETVITILSKIFFPVLDFLLDLNWYVALPYTPARYDEEFNGISDGSAGLISAQEVRRVNMIPELTQAACTIVGAWKNATKNNRLLQLRALDWSSDAPVNQFPSIVIYNSTEAGSKIFANIGFAGLVGSITGISKIGISVGEKVWIPRYKDIVPYPEITYIGKPWTFVLRDLVQFANNMSEVLQTFSDTKRTMRIHLGVSSLPDNEFRGFNYASNIIENFDDSNYTDYGPNHPKLEGVFYYDKTL